MRTVYRFEIPVDDHAHPLESSMTGDPARIENLGADGIQFWAEVDTGGSPRQRWFRVTGTGHDAPKGGRYLGTGGPNALGLVWHLWEVPGNF